MTAKELARKLHLSEATVSLVLNGKPGIKKATRDRVLAAAKEHHICVKDRQNRSRNIYLLRFLTVLFLMLSSRAWNWPAETTTTFLTPGQ